MRGRSKCVIIHFGSTINNLQIGMLFYYIPDQNKVTHERTSAEDTFQIVGFTEHDMEFQTSCLFSEHTCAKEVRFRIFHYLNDLPLRFQGFKSIIDWV